MLNRRQITQAAALSIASGTLATFESPNTFGAAAKPFTPKYMLASCMYGYMYLGEILPEVRKCGATAIDIWPKVHGNQREQINDLGIEKFSEMLAQHEITVGCITQYPLGPFGLQAEMEVAQNVGCQTMVTGGAGPKDLSGNELKNAVRKFCEQMKPHAAFAEQCGLTIAIENHANNLIFSTDSLKWLAEFAPDNLGIALAPYHLPQDETLLAQLIQDLGPKIEVFYAWQHGMGCSERLPKEQELLQLPGRGELDFAPLVTALTKIDFSGWTEIFMHPVPRGIPILETAAQVTAEINRARSYLENCNA